MRPPSAFDALGFQKTVEAIIEEIRRLYMEDSAPWVVGYSGGKDSTATLQLVWMAVAGLPPERRTKPVHVISTDTLVENPVVVAWSTGSLAKMRSAAAEQGLPIEVHRLTPELSDSFWVCLIGRGYPAPRPKFRWCTERLKIRPSNKFITSVVAKSGETILVLGTRKAESATRARTMERLEARRAREGLSPNASLPGSLVYTPIEDWSNDDVWMFIMQVKNPWGWDNKRLLTLYQGATEGGECPLVVDTSTPSCGTSRFGCWVCTMVEQDKSMTAMIQNDPEKDWMLPLLELRDELDSDNDRHLRDFRRMGGHVNLMGSGDNVRPIPGPYLQEVREHWLRRVLTIQQGLRRLAPEEYRSLRLVSDEELREIRRIWVIEKHEIEDRLPRIYEEVIGEPCPDETRYEIPVGAEELALLREICEGDDRLYRLVRDLIAVEQSVRSKVARSGLFKKLDDVFERHQFATQEEAVAALADLHELKQQAKKRKQLPLFGVQRAPAPPREERIAKLKQRAAAALDQLDERSGSTP